MHCVILDTETTGGSPRNGDRVVELGMVEMVDGRRTGRTWQSYFDPAPQPVHWGAERVHGLSTAFLKGKPRFADLAEDALGFIAGSPCLAHNARFDREAVLHEFHASGLPFPDLAFHDTIPMARATVKAPKYNLDDLVRHLGIVTPARKHHGALLDSEILALVVERLEEMKPGLLARSLGSPSRLMGGLPFLPAAPRSTTAARPVAATPESRGAPEPRASLRADDTPFTPAEARIFAAAQAAFAESASLLDFVDCLRGQGILCRPGIRMETQAFHGFRFTTAEASVTGSRVDLVGRKFTEGRLAYVHARDFTWVATALAEHDQRFGPIGDLLERLKRGEAPLAQPAEEPCPSP